nr:SUMF1/EgtB/PvdO family nonheme iron enzyme [Methylomonas sp. WSC-7]
MSYAREDVAKAKLLALALENQGWSVFWDRSSIQVGHDVDEVIELAIERTGCMIVGWSSAAKHSDWVRGEATIGRERRILLPILFELVDPPIAFRAVHTEDFSNWRGDSNDPAFVALCNAIRQRLGQTHAGFDASISEVQTTQTAEFDLPEKLKRGKLALGLAVATALIIGVVFYDFYSVLNRAPDGVDTSVLESSKNNPLTPSSEKSPLLNGPVQLVNPEPAQLLVTQKDSEKTPSSIKQPEMITIPAGEFWMGSAEEDPKASEDEKPRHKVKLGAFSIGKYEVTQAEFAAFVKANGYDAFGCRVSNGSEFAMNAESNWQNPGFILNDTSPVVCVSYEDAVAYIRWLNAKTTGGYRLPSEAEWEYAARAGSTSDFFWGNADAEQYAWFSDNSDGKTLAVNDARIKPNAFGLYHMVGNVWEWVRDCYTGNYVNTPKDGTAWEPKECEHRVLRGGSWETYRAYLRSALRYWETFGHRSSNIGFRLAQDLP